MWRIPERGWDQLLLRIRGRVGGGNVWQVRERCEGNVNVVLNVQYVMCSRICAKIFVAGTMGMRDQESGKIKRTLRRVKSSK